MRLGLDALHTEFRDDDIALLLVYLGDRDNVASWELSRDPAAVADTRREMTNALPSRGSKKSRSRQNWWSVNW